MKISICIPQYNRIEFLLQSLRIIEKQTYSNIEISISDDCSADNTVQEIQALIPTYKYPIIFDRNERNLGYDRNYRKCIEMATGDYAVVIGNDDSIYYPEAIADLVKFLEKNDYPEVGFSNFVEYNNPNIVVQRAAQTAVLGMGLDTALNNYSCFSFVGGLIYKRNTFLKYNTAKYDGSVFSQLYLSSILVINGHRLFSIKEPLILKDMYVDGKFRHSYRERLAKKWKDFRVVDGGLHSVINVLCSVLEDSNIKDKHLFYRIFKKIYLFTYPQWILDYKANKALPEAFGLMLGMSPAKDKNLYRLNIWQKVKIYCLYIFGSVGAFLFPSFLFVKIKNQLYSFVKKLYRK